MIISGIDEVGNNGIPACPVCGIGTTYWVVQDCNNKLIAFLNYGETSVRINSEFNITIGTMSDFLANARRIKCVRCGTIDADILFRVAIGAVKNNVRRFPEVVRYR